MAHFVPGSVNPTESAPYQSMRGHAFGVKTIVFSIDGKWMASADAGRRIVLWKDGLPQREFDPFPTWERFLSSRRIFDLAFSNDAKVLYVAMTDRLCGYDVETGRRLWRFRGPRMLAFLPTSPVGLAVHPTAEHVAAGFDDGHLGIWDSDGSRLDYWHDEEGPRRLVFSRDGAGLIGSDSYSICVWDYASQAKTARHAAPDKIYGLKASPMDDVLAASSLRRISVWNWLSGENLALIDVGPGAPLLAFSPIEPRLAFADRSTIRVTDYSGAPIAAFGLGDSRPLSLAYAPDGASLLVGLLDGTIRCYSVSTLRAPAPQVQ